MKNLLDLFDKTYCINLERRQDRWEECVEEFTKHNLFPIERFLATDGKTLNMPQFPLKPGEIGLINTIVRLLQQAIKDNYDSVLILEDDVVFTPEINTIYEDFKYVPENWDMIYFGGNHNFHNKGHFPQPIQINEKIIKLQHTYTTHSIGIKKHMFKVVIDFLSLNKPLDVSYCDLQKKYNIYSFYPSVAKQRVSFSDIQGGITNYDHLIK